MTLPDFFVIGAAKAGTTSLWRFLDQHPEVYMSPVKEPAYFAAVPERFGLPDPRPAWWPWRTLEEEVHDRAGYERLFDGARGARAVGEASTAYLHSPLAARRIHALLPRARLVAVLRDPADRAYSNYLMARLHGAEPLADFRAALEAALAPAPGEEWRSAVYLGKGYYHTHLRRYLELFPRRQLFLRLYDDLGARPAELMRELYAFLEVDERFEPDLTTRRKPGGLSRGRGSAALLRQLLWAKPLLRPLVPAALRERMIERLERWQARGTRPPPPLELQSRARLVDLYREDVLRLQELLQRDLGLWLSVGR